MDRRDFLKSMFAASALALVPTAAINAFVNKKTNLFDLGDGVIYNHTKRQIRITEPINMDEVHKKMAGYDNSKAYTKDGYKTFNGLYCNRSSSDSYWIKDRYAKSINVSIWRIS
jgi:hypothetical protein